MSNQPKKKPAPKGSNTHPGRGGNNISVYPLSGDEALKAVLQIQPADVKRILASKPGKKKGAP